MPNEFSATDCVAVPELQLQNEVKVWHTEKASILH